MVYISNQLKPTTKEIIKKIHTKFDYSLPYEERIKIIEQINKEYGVILQECYSYYKSSNLTKYSNKVMYDKICSLYDKMSEYILFADVPSDIQDDLKYDKKDIPYSQESNLKTMQSGNEISFNTYIHLLSKEEGLLTKKYDDQNHAIYTLKHFKEHIKECPYIEDYIVYNNYARDIIKKLDKQVEWWKERKVFFNDIEKLVYTNCLGDKIVFTPKQLQTLKRAVGYSKNNSKQIDQDIITILREYFRPIYFQSPLRETERSRKLDLDFMDKEHVFNLIKASCLTGQLDKFDRYINKLDDLVNRADLTETERKIYNTFRRGKQLDINGINGNFEDNMFTVSECARELKMSQSKVDMLLRFMAEKICDKYEEIYEDYYFTFIARGTYKKCSKCGEIKLANKRYFRKRNDNKGDGYRNECRICEKTSKVAK